MKVKKEGPNIEAEVKYPFFWEGAYGCVYMRTREHCDIIIGPNNPDDKIGVVVTQQKTLHEAWSKRLPKGFRVTLEQE